MSLSLDVTWSQLVGVANIDLRKWATNALTDDAYNSILKFYNNILFFIFIYVIFTLS